MITPALRTGQSTGEYTFQLALEAYSERRVETALRLFECAERAGHDPDQCAGYRWNCYMLAGRFEEAWNECEQISRRGRPDPYRLLDGKPFAGKRVLIRCLHGYGDAIQFIRYGAWIKRDAARVMIQTHPEMVPLMRALAFADEVLTWPEIDGGAHIWEIGRAHV